MPETSTATPGRPRSSQEIREAFFNFFREKSHEVVPSAPLVPQDDPTLLFINAGMNPFKDVFLGTGSRPYNRVADTQKCLRVSGKHNDLEEVGLDTYHHTFFEMLGNWSFGGAEDSYFKREAIRWAWELLTDRFGLPADRLYATVHQGDEALGLDADDEAAALWTEETDIPEDHILFAPSADNFWMMGDTGPCGPCSEIHVDLRDDAEREATPGAELVNRDHPQVMEIWNLVFIQYNAHPDGSLSSLAEKHVDTGMGFERLCAVLQGVRSTYDTDLFQPLLAAAADLSREVPSYDDASEAEQVALRVVADHVRTLAFAIADGAQPGNTGRGYVIRRILRRAVRYGYQALGLREPFLHRLVGTLIEVMGDAFTELEERQEFIERVIKAEEEGFLRTLQGGIETLEAYLRLWKRYELEMSYVAPEHRGKVGSVRGNHYPKLPEEKKDPAVLSRHGIGDHEDVESYRAVSDENIDSAVAEMARNAGNDWLWQMGVEEAYAREAFAAAYEDRDDLHRATIRAALREWVPGEIAFLLHDTYGFPVDLTALMAREQGLTVDMERFDELMQEQRDRARAAGDFSTDQSRVDTWDPTAEAETHAGRPIEFVGYDRLRVEGARILKTRTVGEGEEARHEVVLDRTPFYAESGGQVGDTGTLTVSASTDSDAAETLHVITTKKDAEGTIIHVTDRLPPDREAPVTAQVDAGRRRRIMRHHTATHLLHEALRETLGDHVEQRGSLVAPDRLRFDFSHFEGVTDDEQRCIEARVNEIVLRNLALGEERGVPIEDAKARGARALFGEKYGDTVRVIAFEDASGEGDFRSVELCGGTHVRSTGEVGLFRLVSEGSVASGIRRVEAVAGEAALDLLNEERETLEAVRGQFKQSGDPAALVADLAERLKSAEAELEAAKQEQAAAGLDRWIDEAEDVDGVRLVTARVETADMDVLRDLAEQARDRLGENAVVVFGAADTEAGKAYLAASVTDDLVTQGIQAGRLVGALATRLGGGGGGRPHLATAGGRQPESLGEALQAVADELRSQRNGD